MYTCYSLVNGMLHNAFLVGQSIQRLLQIVCKLFLI